MTGEENLAKMFALADTIDRNEGKVAYVRYRDLMWEIAFEYKMELELVVAAFVSLSPNNDYLGNLRSLITLLDGIRDGKPLGRITCSTYRHCLERAYNYATRKRNFLAETTGQKILNFYHNIITPYDNRWVTIDGHINAVWLGLKSATMKQAILRKRADYAEVANAIKRLAFREYLLPNQYQAILWFTRKRVINRVYDPQLDLLSDPWKVYRQIKDIRPYPENTDAGI